MQLQSNQWYWLSGKGPCRYLEGTTFLDLDGYRYWADPQWVQAFLSDEWVENWRLYETAKLANQPCEDAWHDFLESDAGKQGYQRLPKS